MLAAEPSLYSRLDANVVRRFLGQLELLQASKIAEMVRVGRRDSAADGALAAQPGRLPQVPWGQRLSGRLALCPTSGRRRGLLSLAIPEGVYAGTGATIPT